MPPPPPQKGPSEYIPSRTYPDPFVNIAPGYVPMHHAGCCGPWIPPPPFPPPFPPPPPGPEPEPECECPPKIYRNPPDVIVAAGDYIAVETDTTDTVTTYTVSGTPVPISVDPESADILYGNGTPETPLGVDLFAGATADEPGLPGAVPAPGAGDDGKFLRGDGTWATADITRECTAEEMNSWLEGL